MPERRFDTGYWNDPDIMKLPMKAKLLYLYLWTNRHCNQAGLYEVALETIQFETGLDLQDIEEMLELLKKKVDWFPDQNLIWVKNFLHRQSQSPQFLAAAAKCLKAIGNNGIVKEFLRYNEVYTLSIPYPYPIDRVSIPPYSDSLSHAGSEKGVKGVEKGVVKGEEKVQSGGESKKPAKSDSVVKAIFGDMREYLGYPDKIDKDPIPSYGKEGQAIKRMLTRGFTREEVTCRWKAKVDERGGEFVSMTWVNEDIGKPEKQRGGARRLSTDAEIAASIEEATRWHGDK
jgi:hypothetical protein